MKKLLLFATLCALVITTTSCHKNIIRGGGKEETETRIVGEFKKIDVDGSTNVTVVKDNEYHVIVSGYGNLLPAYETRLKGERLHLGYKPGYVNIRNDNIRVEVHTPYVDEVQINGSGNVNVNSGYDLNNFRAEVNGSGDMTISGNFYKEFEAYINGSGTIDAETTEVNRANVKISGSGNMYLRVIDYLDARITGSGDIYYYGNPTAVIEISGSGNVHKRN